MVIKVKGNYQLHGPFNSWDMNYHLIDNKGNEYLIDIQAVCDTEEELEEFGGMLWGELKELKSIRECKELAWKVLKVVK